jgi:hypothetical protein
MAPTAPPPMTRTFFLLNSVIIEDIWLYQWTCCEISIDTSMYTEGVICEVRGLAGRGAGRDYRIKKLK